MRARHLLPDPLLAMRDETARALHTGNQEFGALVDESAAFERLSERLHAHRPKLRFAPLAWPAFAVLAAGLIVAWPRPRAIVIAAEPALAGASTSPARLAADQSEKAATRAPEPAPSAPAERVDGSVRQSRRGSGIAKPLLAHAPERPAAALASGPAPLASALAEAPVGPDCLSLARQGDTRKAEQCFVERARGSGLGAEMALYELSRLRRDVLGDSRGALQALEEHGTRFPSGSLRREVEMSSLGLLVQLGRSREALERSQALLEAQSGGERRAEIHLFRGQVFRRNLQDLRAAEREFGQAEQLAGSAAAEASYLRGVCLEALAEPAAAIEAYRRYLSKPSRPRAADAQQRLERLSTP